MLVLSCKPKPTAARKSKARAKGGHGGGGLCEGCSPGLPRPRRRQCVLETAVCPCVSAPHRFCEPFAFPWHEGSCCSILNAAAVSGLGSWSRADPRVLVQEKLAFSKSGRFLFLLLLLPLLRRSFSEQVAVFSAHGAVLGELADGTRGHTRRMEFILRYFRRLFISRVSYGRERQRSGEETLAHGQDPQPLSSFVSLLELKPFERFPVASQILSLMP